MVLFYMILCLLLLHDAILIFALAQGKYRVGNYLSISAALVSTVIYLLAGWCGAWSLLMFGFMLHRSSILLELIVKAWQSSTGAIGLISINVFAIVGALISWWTDWQIFFALIYASFWGLTLWYGRRMLKSRRFPSTF